MYSNTITDLQAVQLADLTSSNNSVRLRRQAIACLDPNLDAYIWSISSKSYC